MNRRGGFIHQHYSTQSPQNKNPPLDESILFNGFNKPDRTMIHEFGVIFDTARPIDRSRWGWAAGFY